MKVSAPENVLGLQMAHKGVLINDVLGSTTAPSDLSNQVGCVRVKCSSCFADNFALNQADRNGF